MKTLVIIWWGTAGWISALYLQKRFPNVDITVVASTEIGIIWVWEATLPNFVDFLRQVDIDEKEFMDRSDATFKLGIRFNNWSESHPAFDVGFQLGLTQKDYEGSPFSQYWAQAFQNYEYGLINDPSTMLMRESKSPYKENLEKWVRSYAYHFEAFKVGQYLKEVAISRGVKYVDATIENINYMSDSVTIESLTTIAWVSISADMFVDCSGFKSLLTWHKQISNQFISYSDELLCDSAVVTRTYYKDPDEQVPSFTESTALSAWWKWRIPLKDKIGNGYVFSSKYISATDATEELRTVLGLPVEVEFNLVKMRIGRHTASWVSNMVGIWAAYGFIEPLESTGLYLVCKQLELFVEHHKTWNTESYNSIVAKYYDDIKNFVVFHYYSSRKTDTPFWNYYGDDSHFSKSFNAIITRLKNHLPDGSFDRDLNFPKELPGKYAYSRICIWQWFFGASQWLEIGEELMKTIQKDITLSYIHNTKEVPEFIDHRSYLNTHIYE